MNNWITERMENELVPLMTIVVDEKSTTMAKLSAYRRAIDICRMAAFADDTPYCVYREMYGKFMDGYHRFVSDVKADIDTKLDYLVIEPDDCLSVSMCRKAGAGNCVYSIGIWVDTPIMGVEDAYFIDVKILKDGAVLLSPDNATLEDLESDLCDLFLGNDSTFLLCSGTEKKIGDVALSVEKICKSGISQVARHRIQEEACREYFSRPAN